MSRRTSVRICDGATSPRSKSRTRSSDDLRVQSWQIATAAWQRSSHMVPHPRCDKPQHRRAALQWCSCTAVWGCVLSIDSAPCAAPADPVPMPGIPGIMPAIIAPMPIAPDDQQLHVISLHAAPSLHVSEGPFGSADPGCRCLSPPARTEVVWRHHRGRRTAAAVHGPVGQVRRHPARRAQVLGGTPESKS